MDFKGLIDHYETLPKSELIEKLVFKNAKLLTQENVIEKLQDENKRITEVDKGHQKLVGDLTEENKQLKKDVLNLNQQIAQKDQMLFNDAFDTVQYVDNTSCVKIP